MLIQQNCQMLWKITEKALFDFCIQKKKNRHWCLIFSRKSSEHFFFGNQSLWERIFWSQCHSRTRSAVYADNSNPWHPKTKHEHPSHWRYVGLYTEYRLYVGSSIFSSPLLNPCEGSSRVCWRVHLENMQSPGWNQACNHCCACQSCHFSSPFAGNYKIWCHLHSQ